MSEEIVRSVKNITVTITDTECNAKIIFDNLPHSVRESLSLQEYMGGCSGNISTHRGIMFVNKQRPYMFVKLHIAPMAFPFIGRSALSNKIMFMGYDMCTMPTLNPLMFEPNIKNDPRTTKCHIRIRGSYGEFNNTIQIIKELIGDKLFNKLDLPVDQPNPVMPKDLKSDSIVFPYQAGGEYEPGRRVVDRYFVVIDPDTLEVKETYPNTIDINQYKGNVHKSDEGKLDSNGNEIVLVPTGAGIHWLPICDRDLILSLSYNRTPGNMSGCTFSAATCSGARIHKLQALKRSVRFDTHLAFCKKHEVSSIAEYVHVHILKTEMTDRLKMLAAI